MNRGVVRKGVQVLIVYHVFQQQEQRHRLGYKQKWQEQQLQVQIETPEATPVATLPAAPPIQVAPTVAEVTTVAYSGASVDPVA